MLHTENDTRPEAIGGPLDGKRLLHPGRTFVFCTIEETAVSFHRYTAASEDNGSTFWRYDGVDFACAA